jgi:hypothetical protein
VKSFLPHPNASLFERTGKREMGAYISKMHQMAIRVGISTLLDHGRLQERMNNSCTRLRILTDTTSSMAPESAQNAMETEIAHHIPDPLSECETKVLRNVAIPGPGDKRVRRFCVVHQVVTGAGTTVASKCDILDECMYCRRLGREAVVHRNRVVGRVTT